MRHLKYYRLSLKLGRWSDSSNSNIRERESLTWTSAREYLKSKMDLKTVPKKFKYYREGAGTAWVSRQHRLSTNNRETQLCWSARNPSNNSFGFQIILRPDEAVENVHRGADSGRVGMFSYISAELAMQMNISETHSNSRWKIDRSR